MAWYDEAIFYHIYPLGLTGAPLYNSYEEPVSRLNSLIPWIEHIKNIGCTGLYIGPLFESVSHGYDTTDYKKLDSRLGTNEDLKNFVAACHKAGIRVVFDGVFNHTGRDFFAFQDIKKNRENSPYRDWYQNVNFWGNNSFNDGFSYEKWGGVDILAKLNPHCQAVRDYICDVIRFWVSEFDIDGIRLDAADVLDFEYMKTMRRTANEVKPDFWLMGEVIHGDYSHWVNQETLHAVTNYTLHKALYSGHNDHNYFEIAHTVKRLYDMAGRNPLGLRLYNFVDNHDVERIISKLNNKAQFMPVHILLYTLPGVPSIYYGSEFAIEGRKGHGVDADRAIRPELHLSDFGNAVKDNPCTALLSVLGKVRSEVKALSYGGYNELSLTTTQYAFSRRFENENVIITVNNADNNAWFDLPAEGIPAYVGAISGKYISADGGRLKTEIPPCSGEIWLPVTGDQNTYSPIDSSVMEAFKKQEEEARLAKERAEKEEAERLAKLEAEQAKRMKQEAERAAAKPEAEANTSNSTGSENAPQIREGIPYEEMTIEELQFSILAKMAKNGPVTDQMRKTVYDNTHHGSLINWVKSFR